MLYIPVMNYQERNALLRLAGFVRKSIPETSYPTSCVWIRSSLDPTALEPRAVIVNYDTLRVEYFSFQFLETVLTGESKT